MRRRRLLALLTAGLLLLGGCDLSGLLPGSSNSSQRVDFGKYRQAYENNWQYRHLDTVTQLNYGAIYTVLTDTVETDSLVTVGGEEHIGVRVSLPHPLKNREEAATLYNAFFRDNPAFFYVGSTYGLEGYMREDTAYYDTLVLMYTMDAAQREQAFAAIRQVLKEIESGIPDSGNDSFETEVYLHDQLTRRCRYDEEAAEGGHETYPHAFTAYGALVEGKAVCEGYARGMQLLLNTNGIRSTLVIGRSRQNGEEHMWNLVTVNGQNYHLDATWNDGENQGQHTFFNLTTAQIQRTHDINPNQPDIDTCTATADNYFVRKGAYFDTYDRDTIARYIAGALTRNSTVIELAFSPDKYDNAVLFLKNHALAAEKVSAHIPEGSEPLWEYRLLGDSDQCVLTMLRKE